MNPSDLNTQKTIVISGAFGYVGKAVAQRLAKDGYALALLYRNTPQEEIDQLLSGLGENKAKAYKCDLTIENDVDAVLSQIEQDFGGIYSCVHAAGIAPMRKSLLATTATEVDAQLKWNLMPGFTFITKCTNRFKAKGDGVAIGVTTAGVVVEKAAGALGGYILAKFALQGLLTALKQELSATPVRIYSVAPGFMPDGMNGDIPKAFIEMIKAKSPTGKLTSADDIAEKISYLISDEGKKETDLTFCIADEYTKS